MVRCSCWRWRLMLSRYSAVRFASSWSDVSSSCITGPASASLPGAFMRGPSRKPTCCARGVPLTLHRSMSVRRPVFFVCPSRCNPSAASARFSPTKGATSAIVPSAARSRNARSTKESSMPRDCATARASCSAKPALARSRLGYSEPSTFGSTTAAAGGSFSPGSWWSRITTGISSSHARRTASWSLMPQSTAMTSVAPSAAAFSTALTESP